MFIQLKNIAVILNGMILCSLEYIVYIISMLKAENEEILYWKNEINQRM